MTSNLENQNNQNNLNLQLIVQSNSNTLNTNLNTNTKTINTVQNPNPIQIHKINIPTTNTTTNNPTTSTNPTTTIIQNPNPVPNPTTITNNSNPVEAKVIGNYIAPRVEVERLKLRINKTDFTTIGKIIEKINEVYLEIDQNLDKLDHQLNLQIKNKLNVKDLYKKFTLSTNSLENILNKTIINSFLLSIINSNNTGQFSENNESFKKQIESDLVNFNHEVIYLIYFFNIYLFFYINFILF